MMSTTDHYVARHVVNRRVYKICGGMSAGYQLDATTVAYAGCEGAEQNQVWSGGSGIKV